MSAPKAFISYCWSSLDHEAWVMNLATSLVEDGVEVILDKWALKEGQDAVAFMESMVTDSTVTKVIIISDKAYAEKADGRTGGVGTETQIISREVYESAAQTKFVAVVPERDDGGKPFLPTFYKSRIYIDLSHSENYQENHEKLLRWLFDKPLYVKPALGTPPAFLSDIPAINLGVTPAFNRAVDALKTGKPTVNGAINEYLTLFASNLERFRIVAEAGTEFDDLVVENIKRFIVFRDQFIQLIIMMAKYETSEYARRIVQKFFENIIPYMYRPENVTNYRSTDYDNFRYIVHELFLYTVAALVYEENFDFVEYLLKSLYFIRGDLIGRESKTVGADVFRESAQIFQIRNDRLKSNRNDLRADFLKENAKSSALDFQDVMQADFLLFLRGKISGDGAYYWWPHTLIYTERSYGAFEIFARCVSKSYFNRIKGILDIDNAETFKAFIAKISQDPQSVPRWNFHQLPVSSLTGIDKLATKP